MVYFQSREKYCIITSFTWCPVCAMLCPVSCNHFIISIISSYRKRHFNYMVTALHQHQNAFDFLLSFLHWHLVNLHVFNQFVFSYLTCPMEKIFHHIEKSWIRSIGNIFQPVGDPMIRIWSWISELDSRGTYFKECVHIQLGATVLQGHCTFRYGFKVKHFFRNNWSVLDTYLQHTNLPMSTLSITKYVAYFTFISNTKLFKRNQTIIQR